MDKLKVFEKQLSYITRGDFLTFTKAAINMFPDYFFEIPASISEKHHPLWANGLGGLVRHTIAVTDHVLSLAPTFSLDDVKVQECIVAALIHDSLKYGIKFDIDTIDAYYLVHPALPTGYFDNMRKNIQLPEYYYNNIMHMVERHMGSYAGSKWTHADVKLESAADALVHLADYIVSKETFIYEPFVEFHCEAENHPEVPWLEGKALWWRNIVRKNKYYTEKKEEKHD